MFFTLQRGLADPDRWVGPDLVVRRVVGHLGRGRGRVAVGDSHGRGVLAGKEQRPLVDVYARDEGLGHGGGDGKSELQPRGGNPGQGGGGDVKVATLDNPCLLLSYFAPRQALLVERPWEEVLEQMPAPLYRHKFGT